MIRVSDLHWRARALRSDPPSKVKVATVRFGNGYTVELHRYSQDGSPPFDHGARFERCADYDGFAASDPTKTMAEAEMDAFLAEIESLPTLTVLPGLPSNNYQRGAPSGTEFVPASAEANFSPFACDAGCGLVLMAIFAFFAWAFLTLPGGLELRLLGVLCAIPVVLAPLLLLFEWLQSLVRSEWHGVPGPLQHRFSAPWRNQTREFEEFSLRVECRWPNNDGRTMRSRLVVTSAGRSREILAGSHPDPVIALGKLLARDTGAELILPVGLHETRQIA